MLIHDSDVITIEDVVIIMPNKLAILWRLG